MSQNKNNMITTAQNNLTHLAAQLGIVLMTAATVTGMMELPNHPNNKVVLPGQPAYILASEDEEINNPVRREREETAPHFISYSETQRTTSRAAKK
jgi:hypothetical protein